MVWKKGESGNPDGLKRTKPLSDALRAILSRERNDQEDWLLAKDHGKTYAQHLAVILVGKAADGDIQAIREIFDRVEGKTPQAVIGDPSNPVTIVGTIAWQADQK